MRKKDVQRKRQAATARLSAAARAATEQAYFEQQQQYWDERLEEEYWLNSLDHVEQNDSEVVSVEPHTRPGAVYTRSVHS